MLKRAIDALNDSECDGVKYVVKGVFSTHEDKHLRCMRRFVNVNVEKIN